MIPHERSLVEKLKDKPFALIGVNTDKDKDYLKKELVAQNVTWRSFWSKEGTGGPISKLYRVTGYPTIYILDQKGVIRFKDLRGEAMEKAVEQLLAEMEKGEKAGN